MKRAGRPPAAARLDQFDIHELQAAVDRKKQELANERAALQARIEEIDRLVAGGVTSGRPGRPGRPPRVAAGPRPGPKPGPRPGPKPADGPRVVKGRRVRSGVTLGNTLEEILSSARQPMAVHELLTAVLDSDYPSKSRHLRSMVNQTLSDDPRFVKVRRGFYRMG